MVRKWTADFETTTDPDDCRVWAFAVSEIGDSENFEYGNSIQGFLEWCENQKDNPIVYFHNLKFDGSYILAELFKQNYEFIRDKKERQDRTYTTLITDTGQFFAIEIYFRAGKKPKKVKIMDSLKILNFSVDQIAKDFDLPIRKLHIDYKAYREPGHQLTQEEIDYIKNDVCIMSQALNIMFEQGLTKMTIASDALSNYKEMNPHFKKFFPELDMEIDADIRRSYKGGFTYLNDKYKGKETGAGMVFDVNSLYPSRMVYEWLPVGHPQFFDGKYEEDPCMPLYVQRITCRFDVKKGYVPTIQIKHNYLFADNEYVKSSNDELVSLTLTSVDLKLFFDHYDVRDVSYDGGWKFHQQKGLFDTYINYWTEQKIQAKKDGNPALFRIAKLMLNSLYGKFGLNPKSRLKFPFYDKTSDIVRFGLQDLEDRKPIYIPVATFITSWARNYTCRTWQKMSEYSMKKYGVDKVVYADTDSLHVLFDESDLPELSKIIKIDDYELGAWKLESQFTKGKYLRQKCYIEEFNGEINVTVAGLPKKLSPVINFDNFNYGYTTESMTPEEVEKYGKKLTYKHVDGGVILAETEFTIK